jgi:hypothetical protein
MSRRGGDTNSGDPADALIEGFFEGAPRAQTWSELRQALESRLDAAQTDKERATLRQQIAALAQEEAITHFIEDSIRVTVARPSSNEFELDDEAY